MNSRFRLDSCDGIADNTLVDSIVFISDFFDDEILR